MLQLSCDKTPKIKYVCKKLLQTFVNTSPGQETLQEGFNIQGLVLLQFLLGQALPRGLYYKTLENSIEIEFVRFSPSTHLPQFYKTDFENILCSNEDFCKMLYDNRITLIEVKGPQIKKGMLICLCLSFYKAHKIKECL